MLKQTIARIFCVLTVFLLSGNVVLSAVPVHKAIEKVTTDKTQKISSLVADEQDASFVAEKDPFEDLEFLATVTVFNGIVFLEILNSIERKEQFYVPVPLVKSVPLWLLVRHILI